jgi:4-oxalocrotonate tautomerase
MTPHPVSALMGILGVAMPYVHLRFAGTLSRQQKQKIAEEVTDTLKRIAGKPPQYTYITFEGVKEEDWAIAGKLLDQTG